MFEGRPCIHHWICETSDGPTSKAECKFCGLIDYFKNWIENEMPMHFRDEPYPVGDMTISPGKHLQL